MPNAFTEQWLLYRIRAHGDADAFGRLYDQYLQQIYRFLYFKVSSKEEAQDLTSETFLKCWQYLQEGKPVRSLQALLYQIARNLVIDAYRREKHAVSLDDDNGLIHTIPDAAGLQKIQQAAEVSQILAAIRLLRDDYREVLTMRYIDDMSTAQIADALGKTQGAVRVLHHRSLETVRRLLTSKDAEGASKKIPRQ